MGVSKWIDGLSATQPAADAARIVLSARLAAVWEFFPPAAYEAEQDMEHVHRLRVATRRARAAMDAFEDCLPRRRGEKLKKQLRRIRRAAGAARDLDVQIAKLQSLAVDAIPGVQLAIAHLMERRVAAQPPIQATLTKLEKKDFARLIEGFLARLHKPGDKTWNPTLREYASLRLYAAQESFFKARAVATDSYDKLHRFRIRGKALRYTLEIFAGIWPESVREVTYPIVEQLQELLGDVVDSHVAIASYTMWRKECPRGELKSTLTELIARERCDLETRLRRFREWWTEQQALELSDQLNALREDEEMYAIGLRLAGA